MSGPFKYGRLAPTKPFGVGTLGTYAAGRLPAPPASVAVPDVSLPVDGNQKYGDCTIAGVAHLITAWDAEVHVQEVIPTEQEVVATYFRLTGGQDSGLNEHSVLETWRTKGLFDSHLAAYAPVDPRNLVELHQAIAFYGGAYLGIMVPDTAQEQFAESVPWTYELGAQIEGGHCIVALGYTPTALLCATWGAIAEVTYGFLAHYLEEAWGAIPDVFVEAGHGPALDIAALQADLSLLN